MTPEADESDALQRLSPRAADVPPDRPGFIETWA